MANRLYSTGFEGSVSLAQLQVNSNTEALQGLQNAGTVWGRAPTIQMLSGAGNYNSVFSNAITTTTGHDGAQTRALHLGVNSRPADYTQSPLLFQPTSEPGDFYMSAWMKLPDNLWSKLGNGGWFAPLPEWKTAGDFRVVNTISAMSNGKLAWNMAWDTNANGNVPMQTFWKGTNTSVAVPQGEWFKVEMFTHRGNTDGRVWLKINDQTVFDHTGDNIGVNNAPINRILMGNPYANKPIDTWLDDVQIWDGVPSATASTPPSPTGPSGGDKTTGTSGNDIIYARGANSILTGGAGRDTFVFNATVIREGGADTITDFDPNDDTIDLGFAFTSPTNGSLSASEFRIGARAQDRNDYVIYDKSTGALYYDPDGNGAAAQIQIAKLAPNLNITPSDFYVY
ncbi:hypothetical protein [Microvirga sp. M2]|uniref:hypothetical protein n=1 Tax=Microvirga sp. M2 TaxID=3073270 RepID=UPI0039C0FE52